jgi:serine/threonine protein kinase
MFPEIGSQYQYINELGRGGTGVVNLAIDMHTGHCVAIKSLFNSIVDNNPEILERFKIEANLYLMLSHPNIVKLKNFILKNGAHLVMEYIEGQTIEEYINNVTGPIPSEVTIAMIKDIVSAIGYAHNKKIPISGYNGVLHLDIKPSNILISKTGNVMVIDYGISQGTSEQRGEKIMGSPMYMAPEQLSVDKVLDCRTDIYSLGVLIHQMCTGKTPYSRNITREELFNKINYHPLERINKIYPQVDIRLQPIIDKATKKNPNDRFQNCDEILETMEELESNC